FPQSAMAVVLAEELSQFFPRYLLQLFQRRPALQQVTHQRYVQLLEPLHHLRKINLQVAGENDGFAPSALPSTCAPLPPGSALGGWFRHPATSGAACPDAAPRYPAADPHPAGHPLLPRDTAPRASSRSSSKAPQRYAGTHTC